MASQTFNARGGLSVGITGTSVVSETGNITGVLGTFTSGITAAGATFTRAVILSNGQAITQAVTSFNGLTGAVTGVTTAAANTFTAQQTFSAGIVSSNSFTISNNSPDIDYVFTSFDTAGTAKWNQPPVYATLSISDTRFINPYTTTIITTTARTATNTTVYYYPFLIGSTCQVKSAVCSAASAPTTTGNYYAKVYNASRTTGKPTGASIGDFGTIAITGNATTAFVSTTGVTLTPGFYWIGYSFSAAVNNLKSFTHDTTSASRYGGVITPAAATQTYVVGYTETVAANTPPGTVGSLTETLNSTTSTPAILLRVV